MTKIKFALKLAPYAAVFVALLCINSQNVEIRMLLGIYALIICLTYYAYKYIEKINKDKLYPCVFKKKIIAADSDDELARFEVSYKLPFPPFIGLEVSGDVTPSETSQNSDVFDCEYVDSREFYTGKIISTEWSYNKFTCIVEPHKMSRENIFEKVIIWHGKSAWKLSPYDSDVKKHVLDYIDKKFLELQNLQGDKEEEERWELERAKKKLEQC
jgi:hypothetical protein